jgi:F-type H+-transporting ATPase subunit delta
MTTKRRARRDARRLYRACLVLGVLDEGRARHVAERVGRARRRGSLALLSYFYRLVRLDRIRHQALVESAVPLPPELRASVEEGVVRGYGRGVSTTFLESPALIGGMRVKVGSDVYDGSVKTALLALEERFQG